MPSSFMEAATAAPPTPVEMNEAPVQPSGDQPAAVVGPTPKPDPAPQPEPKPEPVESKPPVDPAQRVEKAKKEKAVDPAADPTKEAPEDTKIETDVDGPIKPVAKEPEGELTEEQNADLTAAEKKGFKNLTEKEIREVFAARGRAEAKARKLATENGKTVKENERLVKEVKRIATLEAQILELEKRPTTEANDARIKAAEDELAKRKADLDTQDSDVKARTENVRLREYAVDVTKTPDYKKFVTEPRDRMFAELTELARSSSEDDASAAILYNKVVNALGSDDKAVRSRELKKVISELTPYEQTGFRKIYDDWNLILQNDQQLNSNAEVAKKTVEAHRTQESEAKIKETTERFKRGTAIVRPDMEKAVPFLTMDLSKHPEWQKLRDEAFKSRDEFDPNKATPEEIGALNEMAYAFQLAARVSQEYQKSLESKQSELQERYDDVKRELEALKAEKEGKKAEEDKEEAEADEVTPTVGNGNTSRLETFHPGAAIGKPSTFMEAVAQGPGK